MINHGGHEEHERREFEILSHQLIGCAIEVHRNLGPGLLESSYQRCLSRELELNGIAHICEAPLPIEYKGIHLDCGYRVDILIENELIVELKSVKRVELIHEAQLLTYLKLSGIKIGLLINFSVSKLKEGIKRYVI